MIRNRIEMSSIYISIFTCFALINIMYYIVKFLLLIIQFPFARTVISAQFLAFSTNKKNNLLAE